MSAGNPPYLSLGVMCGDEHAGAALEKCLRSVLDMKRGCPFDEIVVGFNGTDVSVLEKTLKVLAYTCKTPVTDGPFKDSRLSRWDSMGVGHHDPYKRPPLKLVEFTWPGRFDTARNVYWKYMEGEWLFSMDADDILADAETPEGLLAIENLERDYGIPPPLPGAPALTIAQSLRMLSPKVTCVMTSYDYEIDENNYVVVRQKMKRLVRRNASHMWRSPDESGIHEALYPMGVVAEVQVDNLGILQRHAPSQSGLERSKRNSEIVKRLTTTALPVDARHAFDVANAQFANGAIEAADVAIKVAIQNSANEMDTYTFRLSRSTLMLAKGNPEASMQEAFSALAVLPDFSDAYFMASHALYLMGRWGGCIEWYERGLAKKPALLATDQPLGKFMQPRHEAAWSYLQLGKPREALQLAQQCMDRYPKSPLSIEIFDRAKKACVLDRLHNDLLDSVELLIDEAPLLARSVFSQLNDYAVTRGLTKGARGRGLKVKLDAVGSSSRPMKLPVDGEFSKCGARIELEDALDFARQCSAPRQQLLEFSQTGPKVAKVKSRAATSPSIAFYCPSSVEYWKPSHVLTSGLGGSEGSVAYLARELAKLGHVVEVYTPHHVADGLVNLWSGTHEGKEFSVIEKDLSLASEVTCDVIVACRAPYLAREFQETWSDKRLFCWHQDNGYGNPWVWNGEIAEMQEHLHVSAWAMTGLIKEAYGPERMKLPAPPLTNHHVLGNGISNDCALNWDATHEVERDIAGEGRQPVHTKTTLKLTPRNPHRVIYASDPSRGLDALLDAWPKVRAAVPDAELQVFCSFRVMLALKQDAPGVPVQKRIELIQDKMRMLGAHGVSYFGWQQHDTVLDAMKSSSVYCYPGGPMPEGFGVSLVQAQACGCEVLCPAEGALPDVLGERCFTELPADRDPKVIADTVIGALLNGYNSIRRSAFSAGTLERHSWPAVAKRFLEILRP